MPSRPRASQNARLGKKFLNPGEAVFVHTEQTVAGYRKIAFGYDKLRRADCKVYYIHSDQLNTPRLITDAGNNVVWQWQNTEAFGANLPNENPAGLGAFTYNPRFPGQYYDAETGLHYNYFRDYDPSTGRYVESDPIGLRGGVNTYGYVEQDPFRGIDPFGLAKVFGNWCGPDWTGGYRKPWNELSSNERANAKPPIDPLDAACKKHDICYSDCRAGSPCNPDGRSKCFGKCDDELGKTTWSTGGVVGMVMLRSGNRDPGPNDKNCPKCK